MRSPHGPSVPSVAVLSRGDGEFFAFRPVHPRPPRPGGGIRSLVRWMGAFSVQMRPYLLFVSGITGMCGLAVANASGTFRILAMGLVFSVSYGFGQALTDCFQIDTDRISSPYRPLVSGRLSRRQVLVASLAGLLTVAAALAVSNPWTIPFALLCVLGLATYTPFKRRWWGGPWYNAWIVGVLFVLGALSARPEIGPGILGRSELWPPLGVVFFGYAEFVLVGYFKDIRADRAAGYQTLPVRFGPRTAAWVSDGFALMSMAAAVLALASEPGRLLAHPSAAALILAGGCFYLVGHARLHRLVDESEAHKAIVPGLNAYVLLGAAIALLHQPSWWPGLAVYYVAFTLVLRARPTLEQI